MIELSFLFGQLMVCAGWLLFRLAAYRRNQKVSWRYEAAQLFFLINLLVIYRMTFHPFSKVDGQVQPLIFEWATVWPLRVNLIPLVNLLNFDTKRDLLLNLIGNFAMFIPTGIMPPLIYKNHKSFRNVFLTGFLLSLSIEIIQLHFAVRASDVDDLILNTAGCMTGYGIYALVRWIVKLFKK